MRFLTFAFLSASLPLLVSWCFYRHRKCGIWTVIISPVIGFFIFIITIIVLIFSSGDM